MPHILERLDTIREALCIPANFHDLGVYYTILTLCHDCTIVIVKNPLKHDFVKIYTKNIMVPDFELCPRKTFVFSQSNSMFLMIKLISQSKTFSLKIVLTC